MRVRPACLSRQARPACHFLIIDNGARRGRRKPHPDAVTTGAVSPAALLPEPSVFQSFKPSFCRRAGELFLPAQSPKSRTTTVRNAGGRTIGLCPPPRPSIPGRRYRPVLIKPPEVREEGRSWEMLFILNGPHQELGIFLLLSRGVPRRVGVHPPVSRAWTSTRAGPSGLRAGSCICFKPIRLTCC